MTMEGRYAGVAGTQYPVRGTREHSPAMFRLVLAMTLLQRAA